ncbi:MAG: glycosyl hydrolase family 95 catalytic domain-containing protein [Blautia sp.]
MNYWPTMASNLAECMKPYNDYLNVLKEAGRDSAAASFGIKSEAGKKTDGW